VFGRAAVVSEATGLVGEGYAQVSASELALLV